MWLYAHVEKSMIMNQGDDNIDNRQSGFLKLSSSGKLELPIEELFDLLLNQ